MVLSPENTLKGTDAAVLPPQAVLGDGAVGVATKGSGGGKAQIAVVLRHVTLLLLQQLGQGRTCLGPAALENGILVRRVGHRGKNLIAATTIMSSIKVNPLCFCTCLSWSLVLQVLVSC